MRKLFFLICCAAVTCTVLGCSGSKEGTVATTDEDEMAAYEEMINNPQGPGEDTEEE